MKCYRKFLKISSSEHRTNKSIREELICIKKQKLESIFAIWQEVRAGEDHLGGKDRWEKRKGKT